MLVHHGQASGAALWAFAQRVQSGVAQRFGVLLEAEPRILQAAVNYEGSARLTGSNAPEELVRRSPAGGRYVVRDTVAWGPAMLDVERMARVGGINVHESDVLEDLTARTRAAGMFTATLDEVLCVGFQ